MGGVSYFAEKGIVSILSEESKCRLVITVKPRAPSATEKGQHIPITSTRPDDSGVDLS